MKSLFTKLLLVLFSTGLIFLCSCSKDDDKIGSGIQVYYVIEGIYDARPDGPVPEGQVEVIASMTMPSGGASQGLVSTPYTSSTREYTSGMTVTVYAESVLSYTTITVKIFRNGELWKTDTATEVGYGNYAVATVSGTL
ncbi:MAG: hypothetical protein JXJ22_09960 [Bacteroidales bacterium]|nr:hypothetical protein [Bacteroidales bacterium]